MRVNRAQLLVLVATGLLCMPLAAQEDDVLTEEFLEYLATLVEEEGDWIDPLELEEPYVDDTDLKAAAEVSIDDADAVEEKQ